MPVLSTTLTALGESSGTLPDTSRTTPAMILVKRGSEDYIPATVGVASLATLEDRLFRGVRLLNGEITPQEYALYEFQRNGALDPQSILRRPQQ